MSSSSTVPGCVVQILQHVAFDFLFRLQWAVVKREENSLQDRNADVGFTRQGIYEVMQHLYATVH